MVNKIDHPSTLIKIPSEIGYAIFLLKTLRNHWPYKWSAELVI